MFSILYYLFLLVFTLPMFVLICVVFVLTAAIDRERVVVHYLSKLWATGIFRINPAWRLRVEGWGEEWRKTARKGGPWVVVVNHQAMLDIPLMYVLPLTLKWVSKSEVKKWPIFGQVLYLHGDILIKRGSGSSARQMITKCKSHLDHGTSVIIFPEGTRSKDGRIGRFHEGAFLVAKTAGVGILPVVAEGTGSVANGWKMRMPHKFTVRVLEPIPAEKVAATGVKDMMAEVEKIMAGEHDKMTATGGA